ncbi:unnamed protein product [Durusdinium trenchii]|uniref:VWFC domain-containing protein n=2 Tax=Durusdinium trenchii TaxID=1381693 RepID=A0ABP0Q1V3_9DINO
MKQVLAAAAVVFSSQPVLALKVPASLVDEGEGDCFAHACGTGYIPKFNHHTLKGDSDMECCQQTCELFTCTGNFVANQAYKRNVGKTNEQCCDQTCAAVKCPVGKKVPIDLRESAGKTAEECCKDTCKDVQCAPFTVPIGANKNEVYPDGDAQSFCCEPTCQAYTCDIMKGLTLDIAKAHLTRVSDETCCTATCSSVVCPTGYKTHPAKVNMDARKTECCEPLCSSHVCGAGWVTDISKAAAVGNTDEVCCHRTCEIFQCSAGWAKNPAASTNIGVDDLTCCLPECIQYQPKCTGDFAPNPDANKTVGQTADVCCKKSCSLYPCSTGTVNIPDAKSVVAATDDACCEDFRCPTFRKKTEVKDGCNQLSKDACEKNYVKLKNTHTNKTDTLACKWTMGFCQVHDLEPISCAE